MSEVQAVIFNKHYWSTQQARNWLKKNNFIPIKRVHTTANFYRYRIQDPDKYNRFMTKKTDYNLDIIVGFN